jgi:hypothetical protein
LTNPFYCLAPQNRNGRTLILSPRSTARPIAIMALIGEGRRSKLTSASQNTTGPRVVEEEPEPSFGTTTTAFRIHRMFGCCGALPPAESLLERFSRGTRICCLGEERCRPAVLRWYACCPFGGLSSTQTLVELEAGSPGKGRRASSSLPSCCCWLAACCAGVSSN